MLKYTFLLLVGIVPFSCRSEQVSPCYDCQLSETFRGVTTNAYYEKCGTAYAVEFARQNTTSRIVQQGNVGWLLERVTVCTPK